jgi:hypothetical protein
VSVVVTVKFPVSAETLEKVVHANAATMVAIGEDGRSQGAIRHTFVEDSDGGAMVIDEWADADSFHRFFSDQQDIRDVMAQAGVTEPPTITIHRVLDTPDRF